MRIQNIEDVPTIMEEFLGRTVFLSELLDGEYTILEDGYYDKLATVSYYTGKHYTVHGVIHDEVFYAFQVYDLDECHYLPATDWVNFCELIDVRVVPVITINNSPLFNIQDKLSARRWQEICSALQPQLEAFHEQVGYVHKGMVISPVVECHSFILDDRLTIKVMNPDYKRKK